MNTVSEQIRDHLTRFWEGHTLAEERPDHGPMLEVLPDFRVLKFSASSRRPYWIYCSVGAFAVDSGHHRFEFFLLAPQESYAHVMTLTMLAYLHANPKHRLGPGHTVNIGEPWVSERTACRAPGIEARAREGRQAPAAASGLQCDHLLISRPYTFGPRLEWLQLPDFCVRVLWALPITAAEAAFAKKEGVEALEQRFESTELDYLNPTRDSVL